MADHEITLLLTRPEIVTPEAPWCTALDPVELAILLVAQPWIAPDGLRCAELERRLSELDLLVPLGPVYFQRVRRTADLLEIRGQLRGDGPPRSRRFVSTAEGFAALVLNLQHLRGDPTLDGREFELKRTLVSTSALVLDSLADSSEDALVDPGFDRFFAEASRVQIWGRRVLTTRVLRAAFDVIGLVRSQRAEVLEMLERALLHHQHCREATALVDLDAVPLGTRPADRAPTSAPHGLFARVRALASTRLPEMAASTAVERYRAYLGYLDRLEALYAERLRLAGIPPVLRRAASSEA